MGCRTGFYLIVRELSSKDTLTLITETLEKAISHTGEIPGAKPVECGNAAEHDLEGAKAEMSKYYEIVKI
jgi:S-ribosylhomocysteine lyase